MSYYRSLRRKGHPLATKEGRVPTHRLLMWDYLNGRSARCAWCYRHVGWNEDGKGELVVDHVDGDRFNNTVENLAVSCRGCNGNRNRSQPSHLCSHCGVPFKGRRERKFCTQSCSSKSLWQARRY